MLTARRLLDALKEREDNGLNLDFPPARLA